MSYAVVNGEMANFDPYGTDNPQPIAKNLLITVNYISEAYSCQIS